MLTVQPRCATVCVSLSLSTGRLLQNADGSGYSQWQNAMQEFANHQTLLNVSSYLQVCCRGRHRKLCCLPRLIVGTCSSLPRLPAAHLAPRLLAQIDSNQPHHFQAHWVDNAPCHLRPVLHVLCCCLGVLLHVHAQLTFLARP